VLACDRRKSALNSQADGWEYWLNQIPALDQQAMARLRPWYRPLLGKPRHRQHSAERNCRQYA